MRTTWIVSTAAARGTTRLEGLAEEHDKLDEQEEDEAGERLLTRLGMSEYYGSEGFDHPPCAVGRVCTRTAAAISAGDDGAGA